MNNFKVRLTSKPAIDLLTLYMPVARDVCTAQELKAFGSLIYPKVERLEASYPGLKQDIVNVTDALFGTAEAAHEIYEEGCK